MISVLDHGLNGSDPNFDNTSAFNAMIAGIGLDRHIYFPAGAYYFKTKPDVISNCQIVLEGCGLNNTSLIRDYNESNPNNALISSTVTLNVKNMSIEAGTNKTGGSAIRLSGLQASASILRDLYITGMSGGTWVNPVVLYSTAPLGIRGCVLDNVEIFAATNYLLWGVNVQGLMAQFQGYPAGGTSNFAGFQHYGSYRSSAINIRTRYLEKLYLTNTDNLIIMSTNTTLVQSNCSHIKSY